MIVFAGAGVSMVAPTSLPGRSDFVAAVLRALAEQVGAYTSEGTGRYLLRELAVCGPIAVSPDYMADIIAEEEGENYFRVLQALDTEETNACHRAIAAMARGGTVRAVVTTNFDRLLERACEQAGVAYRAYASPEDFDELRMNLEAGEPPAFPIVKVHGTADAPQTMVDTLSQRLAGRPQSLEAALSALYARHHILFAGFSGADLDYDSNYLGLRAAAAQNEGFTFLARRGSPVRPSILELRSLWGNHSVIEEGELPGWLVEHAGKSGANVHSPSAEDKLHERQEQVLAHARQWAQHLGMLQAVNIFVSLLRAGGKDRLAGHVLYIVWTHYRRSEDSDKPAYGRFNHHLGRMLLDYGETLESLRPSTSFRQVWSSDGRDLVNEQTALDFLAMTPDSGYYDSLPDLAVCYALFGATKKALDVVQALLRSAAEHSDLRRYVIGALAGGAVWSIAGVWSEGLEHLEHAYRLATHMGHEPSRARLCAHLVRFLGWKERHEEAAARYEEGLRIAGRLGMRATQSELSTAWASALVEQGRAPEALPLSGAAYDYFHETGRLAMQTRAALDHLKAAIEAGNQEGFDRALAWLAEGERGYTPHVALLRAEASVRFGTTIDARQELDRALSAAEGTGNEWALLTARDWEQVLAEREQRERAGQRS